MNTTIEFLNAVKSRHHLATDGRLAAKMGLTRSSICRFMQEKDYMGDETALKVADLLELDAAYVVACAHAERSKDAILKKVWERLAKMASHAAPAILVFAFALPAVFSSFGSTSAGQFFAENSRILYIMLNCSLFLFFVYSIFYALSLDAGMVWKPRP